LEPRRVLSAANLLITEFLATNDGLVEDGDGNHPDWIEVCNADSVTVNLGDYCLTDNESNLQKWAFPSINLVAGSYLVVFASAPLDSQGDVIDDYIDELGYCHTNFKLDAEGEWLALTYEDPATHVVSVVHEYAPEFPEQFPNVSYGIASGASLRYFDTPTLGQPNGVGWLGVVADTEFSVDRGFYDDPFQVEITTHTAGADIYYTTNGSTPTPTTGTLYAGPITIDHTTPLRAMAVKTDWLPTNVDTQTYLFLDDIVRQDYQATLDAGFPEQWGSFGPDYGLDPDVVGTFDADGNPLGGDLFGGIYAATIKDDLKSLPTLSIVMNADDLFGPDGIYTNSTHEGEAWERATSAEWITSDGSEEFQVDAGIRIQGGWFRDNSYCKKHSFRLLFKNEYGPTELVFPLFGDGAVDEFNTIVLRAGANDGYAWSAARLTEQYTRDEFGRSLQLATGNAGAHGNFVHLYINGIYWGLYNPVERPDNEFAASYLGGEADNWDAIHVDEASEGDFVAWNAMLAKTAQAGTSLAAYMELQGLNLDGTRNTAHAPLLDVQNYVDYLLVNVWGGNWDWPWKNFWAGRDRDRKATTGFHFFNWDFENTMGNNRSRSPLGATTLDQDFTGYDNAGQPHTNLKTNAEYRLLFADRVQKFFFNDGVLTPNNLIARYQEIADQVERAMVAESARWGDTQWSTPLTLAEWTTERDWILGTYLPQRSGIVMNELRAYGLYPDIDAPTFNQHGGYVPTGFDLTMSAPLGTVYYTLDGSDPRLVGGAVSGSALVYTGTPIEITGPVTVKAREMMSGEWSALNEAEFTTAAPGDVSQLRVTELHYHPANHPGVVDDEDLEFIEVLNTDDLPVSLDGVRIAGFANEPYEFDNGLVLAPGERIVVARSPAVFQSVYGTDINLAPSGYYDSNLGNGGEPVILRGPLDQTLQSITYDDVSPWPATPDGDGPSLEIIDPLASASDPGNWRASLYVGGSPGWDGSPIAGDYDTSGLVDEADFGAWKAAFGASVAPGSGADGNGDGVVDAADYTVWRDNLGTMIAPILPGDYNRDNQVNSSDYDVWKVSFGATSGLGLAADGNRNGVVDTADYTVWRDHLGEAIGYSAGATGSGVIVDAALAIEVAPAAEAAMSQAETVVHQVAFDQLSLPSTTSRLGARRSRLFGGEHAPRHGVRYSAPASNPAHDDLLLLAMEADDSRPEDDAAVESVSTDVVDNGQQMPSEDVDRAFELLSVVGSGQRNE
jgi:hypothetical protein